jgi:hypothetical protein
MRFDAEVRGQLAQRYEVLLPHLNERQQRLALATEAVDASASTSTIRS